MTERASDGYSVFVIGDDDGVLRLRFERDGIDQSAVVPGDPEELVFAYMRGMMAAFAVVEAPRSVLLVGLGGGSFPMFVRRKRPELPIDVVEIDPVVLAVAEEDLGFERDARLKVHIEDGRHFIERASGRWHVIALDAYGPDQIPGHLATRSFYEAVRGRLEPDGVMVANLWSEYASPHYLDMLRTIEAVFPDVHVIAPPGSESRIVLAFPVPNGLTHAVLIEQCRALKKAWGLRFDLAHMVKRGHAGPGELPRGGTVRDDPR